MGQMRLLVEFENYRRSEVLQSSKSILFLGAEVQDNMELHKSEVGSAHFPIPAGTSTVTLIKLQPR